MCVFLSFSRRPKIHAQRKFAEGCGGFAGSTSFALNTTLPAVATPARIDTPVQEPQELLPNRRPNTEDFLTFLCFRGSQMLPSHLDFFNTNKRSPAENVSSSKPSSSSSTNLMPSCSSTSKSTNESVSRKAESNRTIPADVPEPNPADLEKPNYIPFAVRKQADTVAIGNRRQSVNPNKKRSLEAAAGAAPRPANGQSRGRPRLSTKDSQTSDDVEPEKATNKSLNESKNSIANSSIDEKMKSKRNLRSSLVGSASGSTKDDDSEVLERITSKSEKEPNSKKPTRKSKLAEEAAGSEQDSGEKPEKIRKESAEAKITPVKNTKVDGRAKKNGEKEIAAAKKDDGSVKKEEKSVPLRVTRLKSIYSPRPEVDDNTSEKSGKKDNAKSKQSSLLEISSDDEKPAVAKIAPKPASPQKAGAKRQSLKQNKNIDQKSECSSQESEPVAKKRLSGRKSSAHTADSKTKSSDKGKDDIKSGNESQDDIENTTKKRKKRRNEFTDLSQTDQSENEVRAGRPMRKTKEAAAIYMELIGQKLNLGDFDDDNYSLDSFPELPNVRKTEQIENEIRANAAKEKKEPGAGRGRRKTLDKKEFEAQAAKKVTASVATPATATATATNAENGAATNNKLNKSFSDSDEEPLAKNTKKPQPKAVGRKSIDKTKIEKLEKTKNLEAIPKNSKADNAIVVESSKHVPVTQHITKVEPSKVSPNDNSARGKVKASQTTDIELGEAKFKVPAESVTQLLSPPIHMNSPKPLMKDVGVVKNTKASKEMGSPNAKNSAQGISAILADLMPSKEESTKIFGIASVTLAQSSGPNDTKCTLGKCGSIHKPSLGPVVPTEASNTEQLSSKERRKAKVNMTTDQIHKWLYECSKHTAMLETDVLEEFDMTKPLKPINYMNNPSPSVMDRGSSTAFDRCSSSNSKASSSPKELVEPISKSIIPKTTSQLARVEIDTKKEGKITPIPAPVVPVVQPLRADKNAVPPKTNVANTNAKSTVVIKEAVLKANLPGTSSMKNKSELKLALNQSAADRSAKAKSPINTIDLTVSPSTEKKPIYNRRTPVYNATKPVPASKEKPTKPPTAFGAFSPENEASVYSFDKEEDVMKASPFRRTSIRDSTHMDEDVSKSTDEKVTPPKKTPTVAIEDNKPTVDEIRKTPIENTSNRKSTGVQKKPSTEDQKPLLSEEMPIKTETSKLQQLSEKIMAQGGVLSTELDADGHTFYIPLPCAPSTSGSDHMIQGVAVKLGTEGPDGPNQKVTMHAKLVTKTKMGSMNTTPLPEGFGNVNDILKNLMDSPPSQPLPTVDSPPSRKPSNDVKPAIKTPLSSPKTPVEVAPHVTKPLVSPKAKPAVPAQRPRPEGVVKSCNKTNFPGEDDAAQLVEAPIFRPSEKEFQDPIEYIQKITPIASRFGLCRIIPPSNFKPECRISDDMRFTAYNQYVHKMLHRWGSNVKELSAIKKYLATQSITLKQPPYIGGMEVDLPRLYHTVQDLGGLKEVIEKKKWARVAEDMCIPKTAQDRVTKLDDIYCKYLLPYDTLSHAERQKLFDEVEADWAKAETKARRNAERSVLSESSSNQGESNEDDDDDDEASDEDDEGMECIIKGKSMALNAFFRIARNTMALWFKNSEPSTAEVESDFWRHVVVRDSHVCVHSGSIDSSGWGYGFPTPGPKSKGSPCAKHPWNLKVLTNNNGSILRSIGPVAGVTVPTLHVGMLFSACCWYRDPHGLPWIEYLHTGGSKVWYGVPDEQSANFRSAFSKLLPIHCQNKTVWLPCDTAMMPPHMLTEEGVSLCRTEQEPGQFVVVFPRAYTSSVCTSYTISESVYFATVSWLDTAKDDFKVIIAIQNKSIHYH